MPKFYVSGTVTISIKCLVEAASEEEAREKAEAADLTRLCDYCLDQGESPGPVNIDTCPACGEAVGKPEILKVEKL